MGFVVVVVIVCCCCLCVCVGGGGGELLFLALVTFKGVSLCFFQTFYLICNGLFSKELAMHCASEILLKKRRRKKILFKK